MSLLFYSQRQTQDHTHQYHHICLLSDLTGSKFSGNGSALVSSSHAAHCHLVTRARTQDLWRGKKTKQQRPFSLCIISLHYVFFMYLFSICFISRHRRQTDCEIRSFNKHGKYKHRHTHRYTGNTILVTYNDSSQVSFQSAHTCREYWLSVGWRRKVVRGPSPPTRP